MGRDQENFISQSVVLNVVLLAVQCGFTPQYKGLGALYDKYQSKGLVVLGAPCNQVGHL
jgi:glutathione peroxidase